MRYVKVDTQSDENSESFPSTEKQFDLLKILKAELEELGLEEITLDKYGYLMATLPSNISKECPVVGFLSHVDTSPEVSGKNVKPVLHENYQGGNIVLPENDVVITPDENPELNDYNGWDIISADGTTLLGADDKAGIAEIMSAVKYLIQNPEIPHGKIRIAFTPDEEIGTGTKYFDVKKFGADFAYTVDGSSLGEIEDENFNAANAEFKITGVNVHPGYAKDMMKNSIRAVEGLLSKVQKHIGPESTEGHEGFLHPCQISGNVSETTVKILIRDFTMEGFNKKKDFLNSVAEELMEEFPGIKVEPGIKDAYFNMKNVIDEHPQIIDMAIKAIEDAGLKPVKNPIRGGTDGAHLAKMGLPAPNIFTGASNFHSRKEFIPVQGMEKTVNVILKIIEQIPELNFRRN